MLPLTTAYDLETTKTLAEVLELRSAFKIVECNEPLVALDNKLFSFQTPHEYVQAGAPYGNADPFYLREGVVKKLIEAANKLQLLKPGYKLHIFDGYRPVEVQRYMINYERSRIAKLMGYNPDNLRQDEDQIVMDNVYKVWAKVSVDPLLPTPHSTGAAVDLTIVDDFGQRLEMGTSFDEPIPEIAPNAFRDRAKHDTKARKYHDNRLLLNSVMESVGFERVTHEWWHFSYGDQMWALLRSLKTSTSVNAVYGRANSDFRQNL